jgi:hypothetical protein
MALLAALFGLAPDDQFLEVRPIPGQQAFHRLGDLRHIGFQQALPYHLDGRANVYYGINPRIRHSGTNQDVGLGVAAYVDEITNQYPKELPLFSARVETSPGKFQFLWLLAPPTEDLGLLVKINVGLKDTLGGDSVQDLARVFRLPGFRNVKYHDRPQARLVELDPDRRYRLEDLARALEHLGGHPAPTLPPRVGRGRADRPTRAFHPHHGEALPQGVQAQLNRALVDRGLRPYHDGRLSGPCVFPHHKGKCDCPQALFVSPRTGAWTCFCSDHLGTDPDRVVATGGPGSLLKALGLAAEVPRIGGRGGRPWLLPLSRGEDADFSPHYLYQVDYSAEVKL